MYNLYFYDRNMIEMIKSLYHLFLEHTFAAQSSSSPQARNVCVSDKWVLLRPYYTIAWIMNSNDISGQGAASNNLNFISLSDRKPFLFWSFNFNLIYIIIINSHL